MKECPSCGKISLDNSVFCENCGTKLKNKVVEENSIPQINSSSSFVDSKKIQTIKILGLLSLLVSLFALFGALFHVKMINEDRLMLYPILSVLLSYYCAFKLNEYDETQIYALAIAGISTLFFIIAVIL